MPLRGDSRNASGWGFVGVAAWATRHSNCVELLYRMGQDGRQKESYAESFPTRRALEQSIKEVKKRVYQRFICL